MGKTGWSAAGKLMTGNVSKRVQLQADFPETGSYLLQFTKIDSPGSNLPIRTIAEITWSVEGNSVSRLVTISNGSSVQGAGQGVRVVLYDDTVDQDGGATVPNGTEYNVSMQVAPGSRGSDSLPPTYTPSQAVDVIMGNAAPITTENFDVPQDAGAKSFAFMISASGVGTLPYPIAEGGILIVQAQAGMRIAENYYMSVNAGKYIPLIAGCDEIIVYAYKAGLDANITEIRVTLTFGIDG